MWGIAGHNVLVGAEFLGHALAVFAVRGCQRPEERLLHCGHWMETRLDGARLEVRLHQDGRDHGGAGVSTTMLESMVAAGTTSTRATLLEAVVVTGGDGTALLELVVTVGTAVLETLLAAGTDTVLVDAVMTGALFKDLIALSLSKVGFVVGFLIEVFPVDDLDAALSLVRVVGTSHGVLVDVRM